MLDALLMTLTLAVTALAELTLHYLPWRMLLNGRALPPPWSYVLGVLAMMGPALLMMSWWLAHPPAGNPMAWALGLTVGAILTAGLAVVGAYALDAMLVRWRQAAENAQLLEQALADA